MLNLRTVILSVVVLVVVLLLAVPLVTARTETVSHPSRGPVSWLDIQEAYVDQHKAPIPSYRSPLDVCYDVPLREVASCRNASQVPVPLYRSELDVCSDVGLIYRAQCLSQSQESTP
jgi:hypothetical protein